MQSGEPLLKVRSLSKTYNLHRTEDLRVRALQDVSLDVHPGELIAIVGVSGSGKSTLVHCIGCLEQPDLGCQGAVTYRTPAGGWRGIWDDTGWYRQNFVGVVFQAFHLLPNLLVWQNVEAPLKLTRCEKFTTDTRQRRQIVTDVLGRLGMEGKLDKKITELSGGECQRVAIARALVKSPQLLLADEPTGNLDHARKRSILQILRDLSRTGVAVLLVTHDNQLAMEYADRVIKLDDGRIVSDASAAGAGIRVPEADPPAETMPAADPAPVAAPAQAADQLPPADPPDSATMLSEKPGSAATEWVAVERRGALARAGSSMGRAVCAAGGAIATVVRAVFTQFKIPFTDMRFHDLASFALRDVWESRVSFVTNVIAILFGTVFTALLLALVFGADRYMAYAVSMIPGIDAVHVWPDYSTGAEPISADEYAFFTSFPKAKAAIVNVKQMAKIYRKPTRDTIAVLASAVPHDPEVERLELLAGTNQLQPDSWEVLLTDHVANELENFDPFGLIGTSITLELARYKMTASGEPEPTVVLKYPLKVVGIVRDSPDDRIYVPLKAISFVRDFSTGRSGYSVNPGETVDLSRISARTRYEAVRIHFRDPRLAEEGYHKLLQMGRKTQRFDVSWPGHRMLYLRDVQKIARWVLLGIGILTISAGSISVFNTLTASVARKTREIGILRALGMTRAGIFCIFLLQSIFIGLCAGCIGVFGSRIVIGWADAAVIKMWGIKDITSLFVLPPLWLAATIGGVLLICLAAAAIPSWRASQKTPMDALREAQS